MPVPSQAEDNFEYHAIESPDNFISSKRLLVTVGTLLSLLLVSGGYVIAKIGHSYFEIPSNFLVLKSSSIVDRQSNGMKSKVLDWQVCSYADTASEKLCGRAVKFKKHGSMQRRWMYPNASFGELHGKPVFMNDSSLLHTTRIIVDQDGLVTSSVLNNFAPVPGLEPLTGWYLEDVPPGAWNVNNCPLSYGYGPMKCLPARPMPQVPSGDEKRLTMMIDTDLGVFMDDPFAIALAAMLDDILEIELLITTSRNTTASAFIAAKLMASLGKPAVRIAAGFSQSPEEEHLMTSWAMEPPSQYDMSKAEWIDLLERMIEQPETNSVETALLVKDTITVMREAGRISPEEPLIYWILGPATSISQVQRLLSPEDKACIFVIAMGSSILSGTRLPFGPTAGFTPWPETNVKGDDAFVTPGGGRDVAKYKAMVDDPHWASFLLSTDTATCDSELGAGNTAQAWEEFKSDTSGIGNVAVMEMMRAWAHEAMEQCHGGNASMLKCAPKDEAAHLAASNFSSGPAQCDATSILPWLFPSHFNVESLYVDFETREGQCRGCMSVMEKPALKKCINVATSYNSPGSSAGDRLTYEQGSAARDFLISAVLRSIDLGELSP